MAAHYLDFERPIADLESKIEELSKLSETAGPGAVLGLAESMTGEGYRLTAEVTEPSRVSFIERGAFLGSMQEHPEFCMQVVRLLSENLHGLYYRFQCTPQTRGKSSA